MFKSRAMWMLSIAILLLQSHYASAQDPTRFQETIDRYVGMAIETERPIVFVGSSSILMWKSLGADFPNHPVLNRGFGGSVMSDLHYYWRDLILKQRPKQIFIYEGDNDISMSKSLKAILDTTSLLISEIKAELPDVAIVLISAKPSLQRWHLREKYMALNDAFAEYATSRDDVSFVDIWHPMLHPNGLVRSDLFIKDGLHMNEQGYVIWKGVIDPFLMQ